MSRFKAAVQNDIKGTFLNMDEFADTHVINGVTVQCVIDTDIISEGHPELQGVFLNTLTIYVSASDITAPVEGELLYLDSKMHIVRRVSEEQGMLVITVEANEQ